MQPAKAQPGKTLLSPTDHTLILIDLQSQMAFATKSIDPVALRNSAGLIANAAYFQRADDSHHSSGEDILRADV